MYEPVEEADAFRVGDRVRFPPGQKYTYNTVHYPWHEEPLKNVEGTIVEILEAAINTTMGQKIRTALEVQWDSEDPEYSGLMVIDSECVVHLLAPTREEMKQVFKSLGVEDE